MKRLSMYITAEDNVCGGDEDMLERRPRNGDKTGTETKGHTGEEKEKGKKEVKFNL